MKTSLTLQKTILDRIKTQGVKPMPKGYFKAREYILWISLSLVAIALSLGFGMIVFMLQGTDMELFEKLGLSFTEKILYTIPSFWIVATFIVAVLAFINFRNTRRGYRISTKQFGIIASIVAVSVGSMAYAFNVSEFVDKIASKTIPLYETVVPLNTNRWFDPAHGLLSGTVRSKDSDKEFTLRDEDLVLWYIDARDAKIPDNYTFSNGDRVRLIGKMEPNDRFIVTEIVDWKQN